MPNNVHRFFQVVRSDAGLLTQLEECRYEDSFLRAAVRLGADCGFRFTADDVRTAFGKRPAGQSSEAHIGRSCAAAA